jgi:hypothetical protein
MGCHQLDICRVLLWIWIISNLSSTIQSNFKIIFTALRYAAGSCIYVECCCDSGTFPSLVLLYRLTDQSNPLSWLVGWVLYLITDRALYISVPCIFYSELRHLYIVMDMYFVLLDNRLYIMCKDTKNTENMNPVDFWYSMPSLEVEGSKMWFKNMILVLSLKQNVQCYHPFAFYLYSQLKIISFFSFVIYLIVFRL